MRLGMYVVVSDVSAAAELYSEILLTEPSLRLPSFVSFDIGGSVFALFAESAYTRKLTRGNNSVPYIQVEDLNAEFQRVHELPVRILDNEILDEGPIRLFMFEDPDGNVIEFYALAPPATA